MGQSLIQMPKTADIIIAGSLITIEDHKVKYNHSLLSKIRQIVSASFSNRNTLYQFEKHGVSFEAAIEYCVREIEHDTKVFADFIYWEYYHFDVSDKKVVILGLESIRVFTESEAGRIIAGQFVEKIRICNNWEELYDEFHYTSRFQQDIKSRICKELEQCRRV